MYKPTNVKKKMKMKTNETKNAAMPYEAPQVEVIEVAVEKGFAGSDVNGTGDDIYIK